MSRFPVPCTKCGEPTRTTMCDACQRMMNRGRIQDMSTRPTRSADDRGYNSRWRRLSERARKLQPFCSDCGSRRDLQADHTPEAWQRVERGLPLRLEDIDVVCQRCNIQRGPARGPRTRSQSRGSAGKYPDPWKR